MSVSDMCHHMSVSDMCHHVSVSDKCQHVSAADVLERERSLNAALERDVSNIEEREGYEQKLNNLKEKRPWVTVAWRLTPPWCAPQYFVLPSLFISKGSVLLIKSVLESEREKSLSTMASQSQTQSQAVAHVTGPGGACFKFWFVIGVVIIIEKINDNSLHVRTHAHAAH